VDVEDADLGLVLRRGLSLARLLVDLHIPVEPGWVRFRVRERGVRREEEE